MLVWQTVFPECMEYLMNIDQFTFNNYETCNLLPLVIGKMVEKPLGWGPLNNQPHIHLISRGYLLGPISPFKGLQQGG